MEIFLGFPALSAPARKFVYKHSTTTVHLFTKKLLHLRHLLRNFLSRLINVFSL